MTTQNNCVTYRRCSNVWGRSQLSFYITISFYIKDSFKKCLLNRLNEFSWSNYGDHLS